MNQHLTDAEIHQLEAELDDLSAARGIAIGLCISLAFFAVVIGGAGVWLGWWS